jgi:hypothetical protein
VHWECEDVFDVTIRIDWGDGQSDSYTCWANCGSGDTTFRHLYTYANDFHPEIGRTGTGQVISPEILVR